jgi:hypothetical protein
MSYITPATDVTDSLVRNFVSGSDTRLATWLANTDSEIESIAQERGLLATDIETPVHYKIKEYAIAYYCYLVCQDCFGENTVDIPEQEVYKVKLDYYLQKCNFLRPNLTKNMFLYESADLEPSDRIGGGQIWI